MNHSCKVTHLQESKKKKTQIKLAKIKATQKCKNKAAQLVLLKMDSICVHKSRLC